MILMITKNKNLKLKIRIKNQMKMKKIKKMKEEETKMKNQSINRKDLRQPIAFKVNQNLNNLKLNKNPSNHKNLHKRIKTRSKIKINQKM
jgi:hypothetical protein